MQSGVTSKMLTEALQSLRAGHRVAVVVHEVRFSDYCKRLLGYLGAKPAEIRRISFVAATEHGSPHRLRGQSAVFVDHTAWESVTGQLSEAIAHVWSRNREREGKGP